MRYAIRGVKYWMKWKLRRWWKNF
jgi:hypothetical protein